MKVLHVISGGDTGGAKTSVLILIEALNALGIQTKLVCFIEGIFATEARDRGLEVVVLNQKSRFDLSIRKPIEQLVIEEGFDLVNTHGARANFVMALMKKQLKIPIITTIHSDYKHDFDNSLPKKIIFTFLNAFSLKKLTYYITMAQSFKEIMVDRGFKDSQIYVAYNGVPKAKEAAIDKKAFLQQYGINYDPNKIYVGIASRMHPIKGVDVFIKGASLVKKERDDIIFLVAGYGEDKYTKLYENLADSLSLDNTLYFIGFVDDIMSFYNAVDINTNTSHSEAVCYALLEGGSLKKATVASAIGGSVELIDHDSNGYLFPDGDWETFSKQIIQLASQAALRKRLGQGLYNTIEQSFSTKAMGERYITIYKEIERLVHEKR